MIVSTFSYLGLYLPRGGGGSCKKAQRTLAGQALKTIFVFALNKYLYKVTYLKPSHVLDLFDKLISPILNYDSEVYDFGDIWEAQGVENPKSFLDIFKQRIKDNFVLE